jgi:hypothetical protein
MRISVVANSVGTNEIGNFDLAQKRCWMMVVNKVQLLGTVKYLALVEETATNHSTRTADVRCKIQGCERSSLDNFDSGVICATISRCCKLKSAKADVCVSLSICFRPAASSASIACGSSPRSQLFPLEHGCWISTFNVDGGMRMTKTISRSCEFHL